MTPPKVTRKVYSAEELHRLRGTQSQPKLREAIEEKDGEDADIVKEHVLRGSRSFAARSFRSRPSANSLRVPSNKSNNENLSATAFGDSRLSNSVESQPIGRVLGEIPPNGQVLRPSALKTGRSPTPSIKKKKAEAIVKAHGSPTHVRVTAGGRIVPSDQSPLCHPRYGYSAVKTNGGLIKFAPNYPGKPQWTQATENGYVAQDIHGNLCQIVNGTILPLNEVDGALRLYMPAPNLKVTQRGSSLGPVNAPFAQNGNQQNALVKPDPVTAPEPSAESQITALELEYSKLESQLKDVDKTEVIHGRTMGKVAKDALIAKRRELVMNMDKVRKAVKGLKNQPPPNAPTSPRAMLNRPSASPPRNRLPPFLQKQLPDGNAAQGPFGSIGNGPPALFGAQFGPQPTPSPEDAYAGPPWAMPPPGMYVPPPPFDGGMAPPFAAFPQSAQLGAVDDQIIPQNDGTSHAVSIRAPDAKPSLKSALNPMSPVYKPARENNPIKDRVPTPLSPLRQLQPPAQSQKASIATNETISPAKKSTHLQSSSISSFETADFFPRSTNEYSMRHHVYPLSAPSDGKENTDPEHTELQHSPQQYKGPPGTPVYHDKSILQPIDRDTHNVSPKSKREWLFIQERPEATQPSSSPARMQACQDEINFSDKPREWILGFQAGLLRESIGKHRDGVFLQGYCDGLLKSKPEETTESTSVPSKQPVSRRPSPAPVQMSEKTATAPRPPFVEMNAQSMDTLKQAVLFAPGNENAVLTPAADGPHVTEGSFHLERALNPAGFPFPQRTSSAIQRQGVMSEVNIKAETQPAQMSPALSTQSIASSSLAGGSAPNTANRIASIDSSMQRRIMTPTEWKSGSSVAHAAGLATGYFANAQFDGASQRVTSMTSNPAGRFREASLDGLSPVSPSEPMSPNLTPRDKVTKRKDSTPVKGLSPAKAKFEHMAEKVGIKTSKPDVSEPNSPTGKRRWRDVWRKGGRDTE